ncbi:Holliday junction resolvase RuvX [Patescibacteria group bacterium]|nr:Holliday junction resolvase RuvX [Patescibacteria group bacterium]
MKGKTTIMNMGRVLAIDYGTKRVGLATAWAGLAEPLKVIQNDGTNALYATLQAVIEEIRPELIVVGLSENEMAEQTRTFVKNLKEYLWQSMEAVPEFVFTDETLSSAEVQRKLKEAGHRDLRQEMIDHYAAAQFLQEYLDLHQSSESQ